ncbi:MAG: MFS transporter [Myxococcota bacterium]
MTTTPSPPVEHVPRRIRLLYGSGSIAEGTKNTAFNVFLLFYYNQVLGLSGTYTGAAIFVALCVDAVTDPLVGKLSDHTHSRWGRRHPYMYAAGVPMGVSFFFLFDPPAGLGPEGLFAWLTVFAILVRVSMTLYSIPSGSMIPEMTSHYDERTSLTAYRFTFGFLGGLGSSLLGYLVFFAERDGVDGRLVADSYHGFAAVCGILMFVAIMTCSLGTHRIIPLLRAPVEETPTLRSFFHDVRVLLANRSYRSVVLGLLFASAAGGFNDVVGLYMNTFFWEFTAEQIAIFVAAIIVAILLAAPLARPISERFDKKQSVMGMGVIAVFIGPLPVFLRLAGWMPANGDPLLFWLLFVHAGVIVSLVFAISIIIASMVSDTVDVHELNTGKRQEGLIVSAVTFTQKAASGIGGFVAGVALDLIAFPRQIEGVVVPPEKLEALGYAVGPGLLGFYFLLLFFISRYRLTRSDHREVLAKLAESKHVDAAGAEDVGHKPA